MSQVYQSHKNWKCPTMITTILNFQWWGKKTYIVVAHSSILSVAVLPRACSGAGEEMFLVPQQGRTG